MSIKEEIKIREKEEELLQFTSFSNEDALKIGLAVREMAEKKFGPVAIEIEVNGLVVFHYSMPGTNGRNNMWVERKANMVRVSQVSTLHAMQLRERDKKDMQADWGLDPMEYAAIGGGFPIRLKGTGIIGAIAVSGLPHTEDHRLIVETLAELFGAEL